MFCSSCGNPIKEGFKFCVKCGNQVNSATDQSSASNAVSVVALKSSVKTPTLNAFMLKKKDERSCHFKTKKGKHAKLEDEEVSINIGVMKFNEDGQLKPLRGKNLPLKVRKSANSKDILTLAVTKHAMHNSNDIIKSSPECYKLLYPDGTLAQTLKESDEPFTLCQYKCEIGKPYNRLTFYVCSNSDFFQRTVDSLLNTGVESSDDEEVLEVPQKKVCVSNSQNSSDAKSSDRESKDKATSNPTSSKISVDDSPAVQINSDQGSSCHETTPHSIVKGIFPHLSDLAILNALR